MGDVYCKLCGEPWDYYGVFHGDMTKEEAKKFLAGKGCPSCKFGQDKELIAKGKEEQDSLTEEFLWSLFDHIE